MFDIDFYGDLSFSSVDIKLVFMPIVTTIFLKSTSKCSLDAILIKY